MLTGDSLGVDKAYDLGMVFKVFPADALSEQTRALAERIATMDSMAALLIKESVNQTLDNMGFTNALQACFSIHQLNHSHWAERTDGYTLGTPELGVQDWRSAGPVRPAQRSEP